MRRPRRRSLRERLEGLPWFAITAAIAVLIGLLLRLKGIHNPILDHPNWRQGDMASVARNFAQLQYNPLYPQADYDGAPPNYVELELQIVPFLAATLYKLVGIHEIFGRLITIGFSLATVWVLALFGRWLFANPSAGIAAAIAYAIMPGSVYYGRTFTPDATMVFFLAAALYVGSHMLVEDEALGWGTVARATALVTLAYLAKSVAVVAALPLLAVAIARRRAGRTMPVLQLATFFVVPFLVLGSYDRDVSSHAEWHWASGIMTLHVIPELLAAFGSGGDFANKLGQFWTMLDSLRATMIGTAMSVLAVIGFVALPFLRVRSRSLLWAWLAGGLLYTFVVVTVERVDYYMFLLLPLAALAIAALATFLSDLVGTRVTRFGPALVTAAVILAAWCAIDGVNAVGPYYTYNKQAYRDAIALNATLDPHALVVMAHYGPDVLYYMNRFGWEEDPLLWRPFDQKSAIRKGARYFISIEDRRMRRNVALCTWLQQFPLLAKSGASWPVYETDFAKRRAKPGSCG
ncbi:MAG: glycosyltransferase family 39 protein [Candidatus Eremiobacteraeota bacterium]|nr:glycosyltransferase family 39 protein [Candidatus Eremiobacteraeota bacterium]